MILCLICGKRGLNVGSPSWGGVIQLSVSTCMCVCLCRQACLSASFSSISVWWTYTSCRRGLKMSEGGVEKWTNNSRQLHQAGRWVYLLAGLTCSAREILYSLCVLKTCEKSLRSHGKVLYHLICPRQSVQGNLSPLFFTALKVSEHFVTHRNVSLKSTKKCTNPVSFQIKKNQVFF